MVIQVVFSVISFYLTSSSPCMVGVLAGVGVWDYILSSRGFNPGLGLRPFVPVPTGNRGYV